MKNLKIFLTIAFASILFISNVNAQDVTSMINAQDVEKFIKTMKPMSNEIKNLGNGLNVNENSMEELFANEQIKTILKKYNWNEDFSKKVSAITMGYTYLKMSNEMAKLEGEDNNMAKTMLEMTKNQFKAKVSPDDVKLLESNYDRLDKLFTEELIK